MGKFAPSPPKPQPPPPLPVKEENPEVERRKKQVREAARRRSGLQGTIKTSGLGDTSEANTRRVSLLGEVARS